MYYKDYLRVQFTRFFRIRCTALHYIIYILIRGYLFKQKKPLKIKVNIKDTETMSMDNTLVTFLLTLKK